ncbi:hypothetical protein BDN71DRAFT_1441244 [Pleurotus eryngii]|uniref:Uncharacterized protein n=1 Tax=Pleurotus eryngii TaxID=5323 RepID=A0A9P6A8E7_PLEER|nr:hypothetical protein BDN71DRAFT_1441244 [Pleurotus eryngii]
MIGDLGSYCTSVILWRKSPSTENGYLVMSAVHKNSSNRSSISNPFSLTTTMSAYPRKADYPTPEMFPGAHFPPPYHPEGPEKPQMPERPSRYPEQRYKDNYKDNYPRSAKINHKVEVCIRADVWVIGFVVGAVHLLDRITGRGGYHVRYIQPASGEWTTDAFPYEKVRAADRD